MLGTESATRLKNLVVSILHQEAPDEADVFEAIGEDVIRSTTQAPAHQVTADEGYEFGVEFFEGGMLALHLLAGTLAVFETILAVHRIKVEREAEQQVQELWRECLIQKGLDQEMASRIPVKFGKELKELLTSVSQEREPPKESQ